VIAILVKFDNPNVGKQAIVSSQWKDRYPDSVPIERIEGRYEKAGRKGAQTSIPFDTCLGNNHTQMSGSYG